MNIDGWQLYKFGTAHVYRSSLNAIIAYRGKGDLLFFSVETRNIEKWIAEEK